MNIALRTSGGDSITGRGEYELAGTQGAITISQVAGKRLIFRFNSQLSIDSCSQCLDPHTGTQRKPRLRLIADPGNPAPRHAYAWVAALLMLPVPKRELDETPTDVLSLENERFVVSDIPFAILEENADRVIIQPIAIELKNRGGSKASFSVALRLAQVFEVWREAKNRNDPLATLINQHREAAFTNPANHKAIMECANKVQKHLNATNDFLELLLELYKIHKVVDPTFISPTENLNESLLIVKRNIVKQWRQVAVRGAKSKAFKMGVQEAYNFRCAFTGMRLPQTPVTYFPGVDAAHILPWSTYDLNVIQNGICLSKLCHWAFDNGIIRLDFNPANSRYHLSVPQGIEIVAAANGFDLDYFKGLQGEIPHARLPANPAHRPNPDFIKQLNEDLF